MSLTAEPEPAVPTPAVATGGIGPSQLMISRRQFAELLGIKPRTFDVLRATGEIGPQPVTLGRQLRWNRVEIEAWLNRRTAKGELFDRATWPAVWKVGRK